MLSELHELVQLRALLLHVARRERVAARAEPVEVAGELTHRDGVSVRGRAARATGVRRGAVRLIDRRAQEAGESLVDGSQAPKIARGDRVVPVARDVTDPLNGTRPHVRNASQVGLRRPAAHRDQRGTRTTVRDPAFGGGRGTRTSIHGVLRGHAIAITTLGAGASGGRVPVRALGASGACIGRRADETEARDRGQGEGEEDGVRLHVILDSTRPSKFLGCGPKDRGGSAEDAWMCVRFAPC
jgi:hypothetical protein